MNADAAQARVRQALELLGRASQDWRNGTAEVPGALHWPVAVNLARSELREALEALQDDHTPDEALVGLTWFNGLSRSERAHWLEVAASARPVDAYRAFCSGGPKP